MENYSYSSSVSSPRSLYTSSPRSLYTSSKSNDEPTNTYKVKFMCSYNGQIQPCSHDNHFSYLGGHTKILSVDRSVTFSSFLSKLSALSSIPNVYFKYQLPGEDLDNLISVTNGEDLSNLMSEHDRLPRPVRLRLFIFPHTPKESVSERQWFETAPDVKEDCHVVGEPVYVQQQATNTQQIWQERSEQPVYLKVARQIPGQGYYGMQPVYNPFPQPQIQQGVICEQGYMVYDVAGRQVYYTIGVRQGLGQPYQTIQESGEVVVPKVSPPS